MNNNIISLSTQQELSLSLLVTSRAKERLSGYGLSLSVYCLALFRSLCEFLCYFFLFFFPCGELTAGVCDDDAVCIALLIPLLTLLGLNEDNTFNRDDKPCV